MHTASKHCHAVEASISVGITAHRMLQAVADDCHGFMAGDHLYRMDYQDFVRKHRQSKADITVAALPMDQVRHIRPATAHFVTAAARVMLRGRAESTSS